MIQEMIGELFTQLGQAAVLTAEYTEVANDGPDARFLLRAPCGRTYAHFIGRGQKVWVAKEHRLLIERVASTLLRCPSTITWSIQ